MKRATRRKRERERERERDMYEEMGKRDTGQLGKRENVNQKNEKRGSGVRWKDRQGMRKRCYKGKRRRSRGRKRGK